MRPVHALTLSTLLLAPSLLVGQAPRLVVQMRPFTHPIVLDSLAESREYAAPAGTAFQAVLEVFESLKIPVTTRDSARGIVANLHLIKSGSLGGGPLSRYLNWGRA